MSEKKSKKSKKRGFLLGLLIFLLILIGIWYFVGKPTFKPGEKLIKDDSPAAELFMQQKSNVEKVKEDVKQTFENVKEGVKQVVSDAAEELQKTVLEGPVKETAKKTGNEYSSAECDLNHNENSPLFFGNPSDCIEDINSETNYLLEKTQFTISYNNETLCPNWVGWHLDVSDLGSADRSDKFVADKTLPSQWHQVTKNDYQYNAYGFDRGHICPSADRTATQLDNEITFLMTNMVPQAPDCNRIVWMHLENYERELAKSGNELYIFAGPYGTGGIGAKGEFNEIPITTKDGQKFTINVPEYTWKIILILPEGEDDFSRAGNAASTLSVCVPNKQGCGKDGDWEQYLCSIDYIEEITGYDFFELLPDDIEDALEAAVWKM